MRFGSWDKFGHFQLDVQTSLVKRETGLEAS